MNRNKRIYFETYATTENDMGDPVKGWIPFKPLWASATNLSGREYFVAMQVQAEQTIVFNIRYCKDIKEDMRIVFNNQNYDINFIDDVKFEHKEMNIKALLAVV